MISILAREEVIMRLQEVRLQTENKTMIDKQGGYTILSTGQEDEIYNVAEKYSQGVPLL